VKIIIFDGEFSNVMISYLVLIDHWKWLLDICMLASRLSKTNIQIRCWTRCSNIQAWFTVSCTLPFLRTRLFI